MSLFLRPTARGWTVALAAGIWLLVAMVNRSVFAFLLACSSLALLGASLLSSILSLRGISVQRAAVGDAVAGETVDLPLLLGNRLYRRRQPVAIIERLPFAADPVSRLIVTPLKSREERVVSRRVLAVRRGEYHVDRLLLRGGDPAGLFLRERRLHCPGTVLVYPGSEPLRDLLLHRSEDMGAVAGSPVSAAGMSQEFYGVREYHPSDGLRYIHWRSSARFGRLMVREFERNAVTSVAILLDGNQHFVSGPEHWSNLEYLIRAAASLVKHCSELYCTLGLAAAGAEPVLLRPRLASDAFAETMLALAVFRPGQASLAATAGELVRELPRSSVVYCLTLSASREIADILEALAERGMSVRWYRARRDAFAVRRDARWGAGEAADERARLQGVAGPAELRPGMQLEKALAWFPV
ncbi:MAG: DUF58 domain-containing protein [Lentisphaeria bacterium]|nr:DUF58 domain-containing protein [Lentisphaeria bacterium]